MMTRPIGVELFCGVGGMSLGFEQAGFHIAAAFDSDPLNAAYHKRNFPKTATFQKDIVTLTGAEVLELSGLRSGSVDVLFGGPPCQGFSEIGRRRDGDDRNLLILHFARLVRELSPSYFVVENVRGLLYGWSSPILTAFLRRVRRAGYRVVEPIQLLDATHFGVPQKRKRVFVLGYRKDLPPPSYPLLVSANGTGPKSPTVEDAICDLPNVNDLEYLLTSDVFTGRLKNCGEYAAVLRGLVRDPDDNSYERNVRALGLTGCLRTVHTAETVTRFAATSPGRYEAKSRCYRLKLDAAAYTLRAGTGPAYGSFTAARPIHPTHPRCITTREAARLHSFPDWFEFHPTKWHGFRQIGNAVPPRLARAVARSVASALARG